MNNHNTPADDREARFDQILLEMEERLERGQPVDPEHYLKSFPEFREELSDYFAARSQFERFAAPLRELHRAASAIAGESGAGNRLDLTSPFADSTKLVPAPLEGTLGDFRLSREIGRGGMGIVYEAQQISLQRRVALKVLRFAAALDEKQLQRFRNEALTAAQLLHPQIVAVHSVGCERGVHYYAMQFVDGQSLAALIDRIRSDASENRALSDRAGLSAGTSAATPFPLETIAAGETRTHRSSPRNGYFKRAARMIRGAAEALEYAHQLGVVHRDIKPANLLLDSRGTLWIADFGLAMLRTDAGLTMTGELVGTLRYMSPEQAEGKRGLVDGRSDIYSLGATLYELLTLSPPFSSGSRYELLQQIAADEPPPPRAVDRLIPAELETIVLKAMAKSPADRYSTAQEFADDLGRFLDDLPIRARRAGLLECAARWSRRHRSVVASGVTLLILATVALAVSTWQIALAHRQTKEALRREQQRADEVQQQRQRAEENFAQARRAVDFFTQVSSDELSEGADILEVRRRLLEGALEYYEEFLHQSQEDPWAQAELTTSQSHANQILEELSAQHDYQQLMLLAVLLGDRDVRAELGGSPDQQSAMATLSEQLSRQRRGEFAAIRSLPRVEQGPKLREAVIESEEAIALVLAPMQFHRLRQIALQRRGLAAFEDPEVIERLALTRGQRLEIRMIQEQSRHHLSDAFRPRRGGGPPRYQEIIDQADRELRTLLEPAQLEEWDTMIGEPVPHRPQFGPGPPGANSPR